MPLDYIEQMLVAQTIDYLHTPLTYHTLRSNCLAVAPVEAIIRPVLTRLNHNSKDTDTMKNLAEKHCFTIFLTQLESQLNTLSYLSTDEKNLLHKIISTMHCYQQAIDSRLNRETQLTKLDEALDSHRQTYAKVTSKYDELNIVNKQLIQNTQQLNAKLIKLVPDYQYTSTLKNNYAIGALTAIGVTGVGTLSVYFLIQAGTIAPLFGPLTATILGIATLGLMITSATFSIISSIKQSEIQGAEQSILKNETRLEENQQVMLKCQNTTLPKLSEQINECQETILMTDPTRYKETNLLKRAQGLSFFSVMSPPSKDDLSMNGSSLTDSPRDESDDDGDYSYLVGGLAYD